MSLRFSRNHTNGHSNIDFRSKQDIKNLKIFEPWKIPRDFGTMGRYYFSPSYTEIKRLKSISKSPNNLLMLATGIPDPKEYSTTLYYNKNNIKPKIVHSLNNERLTSLDEYYKGKERFTGDSMMIADIAHARDERKKKKHFLELRRLEKLRLKENLGRDKMEKNKEAIAETQLVNIEAEETLEGKVDIKKLQEIRLALRRRYANRTNFRKIFKSWDHSISGEISVYDVHDMINAFSIPINFNETRALIASSNKRGSETLNLEEFMHLIFNDNQQLKVDLSKIKYKDEKFYTEGSQVENLKKNMKMNVLETFQSDDINYIKDHLHTRIPIFNKYLKEEEIKGEKCTENELKKVLKKLNMPERYTRDNLIKSLFNSYLTEDKNYFDINKFVNECLKSEESNFSSFKIDVLNKLKSKTLNQKNEWLKTNEIFKNHVQNMKKLHDEYDNEINLKKINKIKEKNESEKYLKFTINTCPSTDFINNVFKDHKKHFEILNNVEYELSSNPNLKRIFKSNSRFANNPPFKNTFNLIAQDENGAGFISEKERFFIRGNSESILRQKEKEKEKIKEINKMNRIKNYHEREMKNCKSDLDLFDRKKIESEYKRSQRLFDYEFYNKYKNDFVE